MCCQLAKYLRNQWTDVTGRTSTAVPLLELIKFKMDVIAKGTNSVNITAVELESRMVVAESHHRQTL